MIDIHTHIIPGVDDGADSPEMALEMLKMAEEDGITKIVATPHTFSTISRFSSSKTVFKKFKTLKDAAFLENLKIELFFGAEVYFDVSILDHLKENKDLLTINKSKYFLLEFPFNFIFPGSQRFLQRIIETGFIPIIVHPERIVPFQKEPRLLYDLLEIGCLSQINGGSLTGDFGSDAMHTGFLFLKKNLVHVISSDGHNIDDRPPLLSYLKGMSLGITEENIKLVTRVNPGAIINNKQVTEMGPCLHPNRERAFFSFFKKFKGAE